MRTLKVAKKKREDRYIVASSSNAAARRVLGRKPREVVRPDPERRNINEIFFLVSKEVSHEEATALARQFARSCFLGPFFVFEA